VNHSSPPPSAGWPPPVW